MAKRKRHDKRRQELIKRTKICAKCKVEKNGVEFGWQNYEKRYLRSYCKSCEAIRVADYRRRCGSYYTEKQRRYMRKYRKFH